MIYEVENLTFSYAVQNGNTNKVFTLGPLNFSIPKNKITFISGRSGSGKSTLLAILGLLRTNYNGQVIINGDNAQTYIKDKALLYNYRLRNIGFALQKGRLLPFLSIKENARFILEYQGKTKNIIDHESAEVFRKLYQIEEEEQDYDRVLSALPSGVSGGQYQRAALARAMINRPKIILADEPTGNLDIETGELTMQLLRTYCSGSEDRSVIIVSHDLPYACDYGDQIIILKKGMVNATITRMQSSLWHASPDTQEITTKHDLTNYLSAKIQDDE